MHAREDGVLFEYFDAKMENSWTLSIEQYVDSWNKGTAYGESPQISTNRRRIISRIAGNYVSRRWKSHERSENQPPRLPGAPLI